VKHVRFPRRPASQIRENFLDWRSRAPRLRAAAGRHDRLGREQWFFGNESRA